MGLRRCALRCRRVGWEGRAAAGLFSPLRSFFLPLALAAAAAAAAAVVVGPCPASALACSYAAGLSKCIAAVVLGIITHGITAPVLLLLLLLVVVVVRVGSIRLRFSGCSGGGVILVIIQALALPQRVRLLAAVIV